MSTMIRPTFRFLSVPEAAEAIGVSGGRVRQLLLAGTLRGDKLGRKNWAIAASEIDRFLRAREAKSNPCNE